MAAVAATFATPAWLTKAVSDGADDGAPSSFRETVDRCATALAAWVDRRGLHEGP